MKAVEFIEMQKQDVETHKDKVVLSEVVAAMAAVLKGCPDVEIDHTKTAEDCFNQMYEYAKKHKDNNAYVFTPTGTLEFIRKYLGVPKVNVAQGQTEATIKELTKAEKKRRSLEDFF